MPRKAIATGQEHTQASMVRVTILRGLSVISRRKAPRKGATINQPAAKGAAVSRTWRMELGLTLSPWLLRPIAAKMMKARASPMIRPTMRPRPACAAGTLVAGSVDVDMRLVFSVVAMYLVFLWMVFVRLLRFFLFVFANQLFDG